MRRALAISIAAVAALVVVPAAEGAVFAEAKLEATNGYKLKIEGFGRDVSVTAERGESGATYSAPGRSRGGELEVDLGRFGSVDLEFVGDGEGSRGRCRRVRRGHWTGSVRFVGDRGFTSALAAVAEGRLTRFRRECGAPREAGGDDTPILTAIHVDPQRRGRFTLLTAIDFGGLHFISATRRYGADGVDILSFTGTEVGRRRLRLDLDRGRAVVRPGDPFTGSATFRKGTGRRHRWHGDLAASLPGIGPVRLAGPRFRASLGAGESTTVVAEPASP